MGFFSSIISAITGKPTPEDKLTLLPYRTWIHLYDSENFKNKNFMATSAIVQGVDLYSRTYGLNFNEVYSLVKKKNSSFSLFNNFIRFFLDGVDDDATQALFGLTVDQLKKQETRVVVSYVLFHFFKNIPNIFSVSSFDDLEKL